MNLRASSIGRRAAESLQSGTVGWVLASFTRVCDLVTDGGAIVTLAQSGFERGPLTILLEPNAAGDLSTLFLAGAPFAVGMKELRISGSSARQVAVDFSGAAGWEPGLRWEMLQLRRAQIRNNARIASRVVTERSTARAGAHWESRLHEAVLEVLEAHHRRHPDELRIAIMALCGLGEGLTPQGDDWLAGWLLGLRLAEPTATESRESESLGALVLDVAAGRTTLLSQAFLACAAEGEAAESWHLLLSQMALHPTQESRIEYATRSILSHGATSGAAMLEGFLAGLGAVPDPAFHPIPNGAGS
jgi:hypothetical protein